MSDGLALALRIAGVVIGFPLVSWAFGSAVLARFTRLDREERFAASFGVGFAAAALCAFVGFLLHAAPLVFNLAALALMLVVAVWCRLTAPPRPEDAEGAAPLWPLAALFVFGYLHLVCIQALLPAYRGSYWYCDWWMHYREARVFVGDEPVDATWAGYNIASRTPLFNLATAFVMGAAGHDFATYQLASALTNICFVLSLYLLLRDLFGRRAAWLALLLAPLDLWMLHNAWFTWPKMLAAYYLILALHFYLRWLRRRAADPARAGGYFVGFGAASVCAYMTHQSTVCYVLPLLAHAAFLAGRGRAFRPRPRVWLACALLALAVGGAWYGWLVATLGTEKVLHGTPVTLGDRSATFRPAAIASWMASNLHDSVFPNGIHDAFLAGSAGRPDPVELHRGFTQLYFSLLTGALTLSLIAFLLAALPWAAWSLLRERPLSRTKEHGNGPAVWSAVVACLTVGTLGGAFLHPGKIPWGIAHSAIFPTTLVLVGLAWGLLSRAPRWAALPVCCGMAVEFVVMFWWHWWLLFHDPDVLEPGSTPSAVYDPDVTALNQALGGGDRLFLVAAAVVQLSLICLLLMWVFLEGRQAVMREAK